MNVERQVTNKSPLLINREKIIENHKPESVKVLFVAEAPGIENRNFYLANTNLYRTILAAFEQVYGKFDSGQEFLAFFKSMGCFLDPLILSPIDKNDVEGRKLARQNAVPTLSERLKLYQPEVVIILMKELQKQIVEAIEMSGIQSIRVQAAVPYPAGSDTNKRNCIAAIVSLLKNSDIN